jgi:hypothetical protein
VAPGPRTTSTKSPGKPLGASSVRPTIAYRVSGVWVIVRLVMTITPFRTCQGPTSASTNVLASSAMATIVPECLVTSSSALADAVTARRTATRDASTIFRVMVFSSRHGDVATPESVYLNDYVTVECRHEGKRLLAVKITVAELAAEDENGEETQR